MLARRIVEKFLGSWTSIDPIEGGQNFVANVADGSGRRYVLKIYEQPDPLIGNWESAAYDILGETVFVRRCVAKGMHEGSEFIILEFAPGRTLCQIIEEGPDPDLVCPVVRQVVDFIGLCAEHETDGCGRLGPGLRGMADAWVRFLLRYVESLRSEMLPVMRLQGMKVIASAFEELESFIVTGRVRLGDRRICLVPVDLNLKNFLVTEEQSLIVLDLGAFWGADPLFAYGEWVGHTHGTPLCEEFERVWGPIDDSTRAIVHGYALLSNLSVLSFIASQDVSQVESARPFGNPVRFLDLVEAHIRRMSVGPS